MALGTLDVFEPGIFFLLKVEPSLEPYAPEGRTPGGKVLDYDLSAVLASMPLPSCLCCIL